MLNTCPQAAAPHLRALRTRENSLLTHRPLPSAELQHCIAMALTYHLRKTAT